MRFKDVDTRSDAAIYTLTAVNPLGFFDFRKYMTAEGRAEKAEHAALAATVFGVPTLSMWALSGGGASMPMWFGTLRPGIRETWAVKQHVWKTIAVKSGQAVRPALPGITAAAMGLAIVNAGDMVLRELTSGSAGILPDADFMKFTQY